MLVNHDNAGNFLITNSGHLLGAADERRPSPVSLRFEGLTDLRRYNRYKPEWERGAT